MRHENKYLDGILWDRDVHSSYFGESLAYNHKTTETMQKIRNEK